MNTSRPVDTRIEAFLLGYRNGLRAPKPPSRDYPGQTSLGAWVADKLKQKGIYRELEEQVTLAYGAEVTELSYQVKHAGCAHYQLTGGRAILVDKSEPYDYCTDEDDPDDSQTIARYKEEMME
jgi:hypothetical protein